MSQYTTGEMARACGVTVRTVQYYDTRGILSPSALTEGGRRLYSDEDLKRMKVICFLREIGLSIDTISRLLSEEDPGSVISILLEQQAAVLRDEIAGCQSRLHKVEELKAGIETLENFSVESIGDIAHTMENKKKLDRFHYSLLWAGLPVSLLQLAGILLWIFKGIWWVFVLWAVIAVPFGIIAVRQYYRKVVFICPQCHETFRPTMKDFTFSKHTPKTRKLTCTACGHRGYCVETWGGDQA